MYCFATTKVINIAGNDRCLSYILTFFFGKNPVLQTNLGLVFGCEWISRITTSNMAALPLIQSFHSDGLVKNRSGIIANIHIFILFSGSRTVWNRHKNVNENSPRQCMFLYCVWVNCSLIIFILTVSTFDFVFIIFQFCNQIYQTLINNSTIIHSDNWKEIHV